MPGPEALSSDLWRQILPRMGARLGFNFTREEAEHYQALRILGLLPSEQILTQEEWETIRAYYLTNSPDTLPAFITEISDQSLQIFKPRLINVTSRAPAASLVRFDSTGFWYGDAVTNRIHFFDFTTGESTGFDVGGAPSDLLLNKDRFSVLTMGNIFPNDLNQGELLTFEKDSAPRILLDSLSRPVSIKEADLNGDGVSDLVVCGFGHLSGSLAWYENSDDGYMRHVLRNEPGAINAEITDLNQDGHPDILVLMSQGLEGFFAYLGNGNGEFQEKNLLTFPSYYGSSYFELSDMNGDGQPDIIYANGDTGDYDYPALKPYHAVRIFLHQAPLEYKEAFSFPIHGPFNSMAEDYDLDGDMDLAITSYFPDFDNTPREGFLFLENQGELNFIPKSIPEAEWGNWLTADRADYDQDGDIDILLGNGPVIRSRVDQEISRVWQAHPNSVILLENKTKN